jgi:glycosyltransferase involved in cell wall biosynthesis
VTKSVLVVIPAFNEQDTISHVVRSVLAQGFDCLVVDDASLDATSHLALEAGATVVTLPINLGVGGALRTGWRYAADNGYQIAVQTDGDGQHPPTEIPRLVNALIEGNFDLVIGSRFAAGGTYVAVPKIRRAAMRFLSFVLRKRAGVFVTDPTSGFRAVRSPLLNQFARHFPPSYLGDTFEALLVAGQRGYRVGEISVQMLPRQGGKPSTEGLALAKAMMRVLALVVLGASFDLAPRQGH